MHIKKLVFLLLFPFLADIMISCCVCQSDDVDTYDYHFSNCDISLTNIDNGGPSPVELNSDSIPYQTFGIRLVMKRQKPNVCEHKTPFSFSTQAMATTRCNCGENHRSYPTNRVDSVFLYTVYEFNGYYPKGSDVLNNFKASNGYNHLAITKDFYLFNERTLEKNTLDQTIDMLLFDKPYLNTDQQFIIKMHMEDGSILTDTTDVIQFTE